VGGVEGCAYGLFWILIGRCIWPMLIIFMMLQKELKYI
jgi:hypothetical protein